MEVFYTGYPLDYYFGEKKDASEKLREKYPGKFILSYYDNIAGNDIPHSKRMHLAIYRMFVSLLEDNGDLVIFLKPKRRKEIKNIRKELPALDRLIREGRVSVFPGDTPRTKAVPAEIGMASDLVVGLGISTAAIESFLAGTISFHADLTGLKDDEFGDKGLDRIVFRDTERLREAIEERIRGRNALAWHDYRDLYVDLDPFQDGMAYKRTGFVINILHKAFAEGLSREEALDRAREEYGSFLAEQKVFAEKGQKDIFGGETLS
jgi:hypothetical protein